MKLILAITLAAMTTVSFAAHKTLAQYDASYQYNVQWPHIGFAGAQVPVKNICTDGEIFKTINDVKVCTKTAVTEVCIINKNGESCRNVRNGETPKESPRTRLVYGCVASEGRALEISRFHDEKVCTEWKHNRVSKDSSDPEWTCVAYETVTKEYADNYDVTVIQYGHGDASDREVATINFELPVCK
jgi:hypothetical protein